MRPRVCLTLRIPHARRAQVDEPLAICSCGSIGDYALRDTRYNIPRGALASTRQKSVRDPERVLRDLRAYYLANLGHEVHVTTSRVRPAACSADIGYRLPKKVLEKEIHIASRDERCARFI